MADIVAIRLDSEERRLFDAEAKLRGLGPSRLAREFPSARESCGAPGFSARVPTQPNAIMLL